MEKLMRDGNTLSVEMDSPMAGKFTKELSSEQAEAAYREWDTVVGQIQEVDEQVLELDERKKELDAKLVEFNGVFNDWDPAQAQEESPSEDTTEESNDETENPQEENSESEENQE